MTTPPRLILASTSPRRRTLFIEHGFDDFEIVDPEVDDAELSAPPGEPEGWVAALAYLKARAGFARLGKPADAVVVGGDTVVVKDGAVIGKPLDEAHAREIVLTLRDGAHHVLSGAAVLHAGVRRMIVDRAAVSVGATPLDDVDRYLASGEWRGKAGGYNLQERLDAGWPIECDGDPSTVMGLPMGRLAPLLRRLLSGDQAPAAPAEPA